MSALGDLSINAKITVSEDTAVRCIELLNIYLADNPHTSVETFTQYSMDGKAYKTVTLRYNHGGGNKE